MAKARKKPVTSTKNTDVAVVEPGNEPRKEWPKTTIHIFDDGTVQVNRRVHQDKDGASYERVQY